MSVIRIPKPRAVIDRRSLNEQIAAIVEKDGATKGRLAIVELLRGALASAREEIRRRLLEDPSAGHEIARVQAFLTDQLVRLIHDHVVTHVYPASNRSTGERLTIVAVGGYGRGEMAPHSDVDIAFITPSRSNAWCEQVIEAMLYFLWDLSLTIGHSSRSVDEMVKQCKADLTIRTAMLEGRYVWGDQDLYEETRRRFWSDVVAGSERQYVAEKLAERDERHKRMGDSRYVVEPNVKEGKGSLRDLHTLYWIGKYIHKVRSAAELVDVGLLTKEEFRNFRRAANFFWAVRCHLHDITGRAEDRLTFDLQREVARRMQYSDTRTGKRAVERFMQFFFLQAKVVGNLTAVFLAQLEEQFGANKPRGLLAGFRARARKLKGYTIYGGRISAPGEDWFEKDPVRLIEIFVLADREGLTIHPDTMRLIARNAKLIKADVRKDPRANDLFMELLTSRNDAESSLRALNEAGVFGRFVPEFGKVNAQMQFDMYHHYTVDEHTIRAIGLLAKIEKGDLVQDHPLATEIVHKVQSRRALYASVLLHDIAKGQGGDHSELGAEIAMKLCPRLGLDEDETELVAWLVRQHLLLSSTAQKRDISDAKTITDFVEVVQTLDRLRQLTCLTIVDIRAVGPGTWNSWKRQLIAELYAAAEERLRLGHAEFGREHRIAAKQEAAAARLGEQAGLIQTIGKEMPDSYWIAEADDVIALNLVHLNAAREMDHALSIHCEYYPARGATLVTVIARDHPGLFYRIVGGIHLAGGNIIDARIHTTKKGYAVDNFLVQDPLGRPFMESSQLDRLKTAIENALANKVELLPQLVAKPDARPRADAFEVRQRVLFDNEASNRYTVIEVNARDRPALLNRLARNLFEQRLIVHSAHVATYGERAVDTFYVTDLLGGKIISQGRLKEIESALLDAANEKLAKTAKGKKSEPA
ncbi:MAG: [protein-PII] uridylyltransferase [Novosphingobium sp.]|nr:[protein-PII] uridylyltransferase [Novosphingobium sp.]